MSDQTLQEFVDAAAERFGIPGAAVGVHAGGRSVHANHGVTSVENPLPVDEHTFFALGSVSKTFTATVVMSLVEQGRIDLDAPVRRYVPELVLADEAHAAAITVRQLLNHTAGLGVRLVVETGDGDDALAGFVAHLDEIDLIGAPGSRASYSQAGYNLLGRVVENVTGHTFEQAVAELALTPLGLHETAYFTDQVMTRRFACGHNADEDGTPVVARQWKDTRGNNPGGGIAATVADQLRWARFHLGDGALQKRMQTPTVALRGSTLGDAFGVCWFLRDIDGTATVGHGGSGNGQFADLLLVPERDFAVSVMTNGGPGGVAFNREVVQFALAHFLGVVDRDPEPVAYDHAVVAPTAGVYEIDIMTLTIRTEEGAAAPTLEVVIKPEIRAASEKEIPADYPPFPFGLLPGTGDDYIITAGAMKGQRGFFTRDSSGAITGVDLAGRLFTRR
ncbi:serine hydrolase domain-containing protein [Streptacidiphilus jiangxiensis]|uniref:CubicO group peptidase, beta-lactamase class C family n=1 Tax=Streptacidiphilus jiangxiensis TaxID=235985 RepID=A0A1H7U8Q0_STRJI|nr:serine hydrolase domain-containing protein [Streptacidiphilus jiangxiensis]SEL92657.1 CubicO group peptidase, beta-lactamase class C family [Streptacidiphilus jiangxiensis]